MKRFTESSIPCNRNAKMILTQESNTTEIGKNLDFLFFLEGSVVHSSSGSSIGY